MHCINMTKRKRERNTCRFGQQAAHEARQSGGRDGTRRLRGGGRVRMRRQERGAGAAQQAVEARAHRAALLVEARGQAVCGAQPVRSKSNQHAM